MSPNGTINPGRSPCDQAGSPSVNCRESSYLDHNNVYVRRRCNNGWCGIIYAYLFEVDSPGGSSHCLGHRYDWEHVAVWTYEGEVQYVAASAHGGWQVREKADVLFDGAQHPKIVYHKDGWSTHAMRFAKRGDDDVENHYGEWYYGGLIDYYGFPSAELRDAVTDTDWGKATPCIRDDAWSDVLEAAHGRFDIPGFDVSLDDEETTVRPC